MGTYRVQYIIVTPNNELSGYSIVTAQDSEQAVEMVRNDVDERFDGACIGWPRVEQVTE